MPEPGKFVNGQGLRGQKLRSLYVALTHQSSLNCEQASSMCSLLQTEAVAPRGAGGADAPDSLYCISVKFSSMNRNKSGVKWV